MNAATTHQRDICRNRHGGNAYSVEAFNSQDQNAKSRQRDLIYSMIAGAGARGMTLDEISVNLGVAPNRISGRISELRHREQRIKVNGDRRRTRTGSSAAVYVIHRKPQQGTLFDDTQKPSS